MAAEDDNSPRAILHRSRALSEALQPYSDDPAVEEHLAQPAKLEALCLWRKARLPYHCHRPA